MNQEKRRSIHPLAVVLGLSAAFFFVFLVVSLIVFRSTGTREAGGGAGIWSGKGNRIGIVEITGPISGSKKAIRELEDFSKNKSIKGVVLRLDSPGGSVGPSQEIYEAVKRFEKPLVVSMGSVAASGAYYIACGAKKVYANPGTITGSIGVIMQFADLSGLYEWARIQRYALKTGKYKDFGAEYRKMSDDERALIQGTLDDVLSQFKQAIVEGRKLNVGAVDAIADGRVFSGRQAKELKLVDELGSLQDAVKAVAGEAGIEGEPELVYPHKKRRWMEYLMEEGPGEESWEESSLLSVILRWVARGVGQPEAPWNGTPGVYWIWDGR